MKSPVSQGCNDDLTRSLLGQSFKLNGCCTCAIRVTRIIYASRCLVGVYGRAVRHRPPPNNISSRSSAHRKTASERRKFKSKAARRKHPTRLSHCETPFVNRCPDSKNSFEAPSVQANLETERRLHREHATCFEWPKWHATLCEGTVDPKMLKSSSYILCCNP